MNRLTIILICCLLSTPAWGQDWPWQEIKVDTVVVTSQTIVDPPDTANDWIWSYIDTTWLCSWTCCHPDSHKYKTFTSARTQPRDHGTIGAIPPKNCEAECVIVGSVTASTLKTVIDTLPRTVPYVTIRQRIWLARTKLALAAIRDSSGPPILPTARRTEMFAGVDTVCILDHYWQPHPVWDDSRILQDSLVCVYDTNWVYILEN